MKTIRVGNGCGFWGDNIDAPILLAEQGRLDYLTLEYLAELTMSILALQKQRDPQTGFATDFIDVLDRLCPILKKQANLKIITNAGGMNPGACAAKGMALLERAGLPHLKIAVVSGDDLMPRLDELLAAGNELTNLDSERPITEIRSRIVSANAYQGAGPIVDALRMGASIVITGRVADASLTVAPAVHEFGWSWNDWDRLSGASVAGHLIECGAQVTGGLWCNWEDAADLGNLGYPIAEMDAEGNCRISKPPNTGGAVNCETVTEQLLYEVSDPSAYLTPDVIADFTSVAVSQMARDQVAVEHAKGRPATDSYKVSIAYRDGFMSSGTLVISGPKAVSKAKACGAMIIERVARAGYRLERTNIECLGAGDCVPGVIDAEAEPPEVVLRVAVHDSRRQAVERFTKEFAPLVTSGTPSVTGYTTGRPAVREVFAYWPALIAKSAVTREVRLVN